MYARMCVLLYNAYMRMISFLFCAFARAPSDACAVPGCVCMRVSPPLCSLTTARQMGMQTKKGRFALNWCISFFIFSSSLPFHAFSNEMMKKKRKKGRKSQRIRVHSHKCSQIWFWYRFAFCAANSDWKLTCPLARYSYVSKSLCTFFDAFFGLHLLFIYFNHIRPVSTQLIFLSFPSPDPNSELCRISFLLHAICESVEGVAIASASTHPPPLYHLKFEHWILCKYRQSHCCVATRTHPDAHTLLR